MKKILIIACALIFVAAVAFAAGPKTYQVTGPVLEVKADTIVVQKRQGQMGIARDSSTKVTGDLKVGSKVTIDYTMKATAIEVKDTKKAAAKKSEPKKK